MTSQYYLKTQSLEAHIAQLEAAAGGFAAERGELERALERQRGEMEQLGQQEVDHCDALSSATEKWLNHEAALGRIRRTSEQLQGHARAALAPVLDASPAARGDLERYVEAAAEEVGEDELAVLVADKLAQMCLAELAVSRDRASHLDARNVTVEASHASLVDDVDALKVAKVSSARRAVATPATPPLSPLIPAQRPRRTAWSCSSRSTRSRTWPSSTRSAA